MHLDDGFIEAFAVSWSSEYFHESHLDHLPALGIGYLPRYKCTKPSLFDENDVMKRALIIFVVSLSLLAWTSSIFAQRGMGDHVGVAQEAPRPIVTLEGEICSIETHPCERTTGESSLGTHLILKSTNAELNIHLGPADAVQHVADLMTSGDLVRVRAFQTENMPKNNYAAQSITFEGKRFGFGTRICVLSGRVDAQFGWEH